MTARPFNEPSDESGHPTLRDRIARALAVDCGWDGAATEHFHYRADAVLAELRMEQVGWITRGGVIVPDTDDPAQGQGWQPIYRLRCPDDPSEVPHCAGRLAVAHDRTPMVDGVCPVCGEVDAPCRVVLGHQRGEPVFCGAVRAIHGDALGMVGGHEFDGPKGAI